MAHSTVTDEVSVLPVMSSITDALTRHGVLAGLGGQLGTYTPSVLVLEVVLGR